MLCISPYYQWESWRWGENPQKILNAKVCSKALKEFSKGNYHRARDNHAVSAWENSWRRGMHLEQVDKPNPLFHAKFLTECDTMSWNLKMSWKPTKNIKVQSYAQKHWKKFRNSQGKLSLSKRQSCNGDMRELLKKKNSFRGTYHGARDNHAMVVEENAWRRRIQFRGTCHGAIDNHATIVRENARSRRIHLECLFEDLNNIICTLE